MLRELFVIEEYATVGNDDYDEAVQSTVFFITIQFHVTKGIL